MRYDLVPVISFDRPDSQNRIIVPEFLVNAINEHDTHELIVTKLMREVGDKALYFLGIIDPNSPYSESMSEHLGPLFESRPVDAKHRLFVPSKLMKNPALSFLDRGDETPLAMALVPDEGGVLAGREKDIVSYMRAQH